MKVALELKFFSCAMPSLWGSVQENLSIFAKAWWRLRSAPQHHVRCWNPVTSLPTPGLELPGPWSSHGGDKLTSWELCEISLWGLFEAQLVGNCWKVGLSHGAMIVENRGQEEITTTMTSTMAITSTTTAKAAFVKFGKHVRPQCIM